MVSVETDQIRAPAAAAGHGEQNAVRRLDINGGPSLVGVQFVGKQTEGRYEAWKGCNAIWGEPTVGTSGNDLQRRKKKEGGGKETREATQQGKVKRELEQ